MANRRQPDPNACVSDFKISLLVRVVVLWLAGAVFFVFHGLSFHLTPWSQAFINAIVKYAYPRLGQDDTTVLLFREENLQTLGTHYPVPYEVHAQVLDALSVYRPRSLFIDFAFLDERKGEDISALTQSVCNLRSEGTEVFVATPKAADGDHKVGAQLLRCALPAIPDKDESEGVSGVLTYPSGAQIEGRFVPSAAFAMAAAHLGLRPSEEGALEIIWGKGIAPLNRKWMKCEEPHALDTIAVSLVHGPLANRLACPYSRTITVNHLVNSSGDDDVRNAIEGKAVFYGASFRLTGDRVDSPVFAEMPGVFLHAMAYDNLVTFGRHYKRAVRDSVGARVVDGMLLLVASILLVMCPRAEPSKAASLHEFMSKFYRSLLAVFVGTSVLLGVFLLAGLDAALLLAFAGYMLYRTFCVTDIGFVIQMGATLLAALIGYFVLDLGPRNVLAFVVFFEVARHVQKFLKEKSHIYFDLKDEHEAIYPPLRWQPAHSFFSLFHDPEKDSIPKKEVQNDK